MSAQIVKFPRMPVRQITEEAKAHKRLADAFAARDRGDHAQAERLLFKLATKMGYPALVSSHADLYERPRWRV